MSQTFFGLLGSNVGYDTVAQVDGEERHKEADGVDQTVRGDAGL